MNYLKKIFVLSSFVLIASLLLSSSRDLSRPYNWYCVHTKGGARPSCDSTFDFISEYDAYYIGKESEGGEKTIYLTFDAGYENGCVSKILDVLKEKNVKGAFFILENLANRNPELVKRMDTEGHLVCNHTATHRDMTSCKTKEDFKSELERLSDAVLNRCGVRVANYYRPPEGRFSEETLMWAKEAGYKTVFWSFAYADWDNNHQPSAAFALKKVLDGAHDGEILLLHPTSSTNAAILGELIDELRSRGFVFKTLDELR